MELVRLLAERLHGFRRAALSEGRAGAGRTDEQAIGERPAVEIEEDFRRRLTEGRDRRAAGRTLKDRTAPT
jgi:hypothetical protein